MKYRLVETNKIYVVGLSSEANFQSISQVTPRLAKQFMPRLGEISNRKDNYTLSLQSYKCFDFSKFNPTETFEKWIGVEVSNLDDVPQDIETFTIHAGKYLIIDFKGSIPEFIKQWQYIHSTWLPNSEFELDNRPHFERLPPSYSPMNEVNEEEIWIPIK
ncbi:AraC family transcriptional regulator [Winogradskyella wandonensis]|uniref:AraC family transcriptional regulator n=1 Tax=Winogradskyella wandonensis TaxID=1442586 RepID=A0A4R1KSE9_9FLAO|nr:GyrI-like domain-containing protein [Winogradskyella wandonensis]TCK67517.1 AraC family transcriptional regulator [Winogradskyella wandonensis]